MSQQSNRVTFRLTCPERRAWVVLKCDDRKPLVVEMLRDPAKMWSACADLMPGDYRCRYYCGDDRVVHYHGPASIAGSIDSGMDALVSVIAKEEIQISQFA
jgi:hypothetical protein